MYFELYSGTSLKQAATMLSDLKLGQYTKLPPRITFTVQCVGTIVGALLNYVIMQTVINNERPILLSNEGTRTWSGQQVQSYNANAVLWGALGKEIYGPSGPYFIVPMGIVIGLFLPIIPYFLYRRFQWGWLLHVNMAVLSYYLGDLAGGTNGYINTWMAIGLTSHFYLRRYHAGFFRKACMLCCTRESLVLTLIPVQLLVRRRYRRWSADLRVRVLLLSRRCGWAVSQVPELGAQPRRQPRLLHGHVVYSRRPRLLTGLLLLWPALRCCTIRAFCILHSHYWLGRNEIVPHRS
jgi:hypothetical protein